jgi:predicted RNA-binding Zn ribbon-like protein
MVIKSIETIKLDGGSLCLDFINTVHDRFADEIHDYLDSCNDLIKWAYRLGIIDDKRYNSLLASIDKQPHNASLFLQKTKQIRELLYGIFLSVSNKGVIKNEDLAEFNKILQEYFSSLKLEIKAGSVKESWDFKEDDLQIIPASVIKDSYTMLLEADRDRIKECSNCGWLFIDKTKNGRKRWCSMESCGSSVKALAYYRRKKQGTNSSKTI